MKPSKLLLDSRNDIPFLEGTATIHPPTIAEISLMGETEFFGASHLLTFSKDKFLSLEDKKRLKDTSNFEIFLQIMNDKTTKEMQETRLNVIMLLALMFPTYRVVFEDKQIKLINDDGDTNGYINNENFEQFKEIITEVFCIKPLKGEEYKPKGSLAEKIAEKLRKDNEKRAQLKGNEGGVNIFQRYISILSIGLQIEKNALYNYTVYQLYDAFERFQLKLAYDAYTQALVAGAKMNKEPDNWQKDLDEKSENDQS